MLSPTTRETYRAILCEELQVAMGCTEPIAIAYAAAILRHLLGEDPVTVHAHLSGNIIKNVKSVIVPATGGLHGVEAAVAAGIVSGRYDLRLSLLTVLSTEDVPRVATYVKTHDVRVSELASTCTFDLLLEGKTDTHSARVRVTGYHTNLVLAECDGEDMTARYLCDEATGKPEQTRGDRTLLNVEDIVTFAETEPLDELKPHLYRQIEMNMAIAEEGMRSRYGAAIGQLLYADGNASLRDRARAMAAAGSDARMSGCELPVCILSESGNQGITASVPVIVYAREMGVDEETLLRALIVADLVTVHQKTGIGCLSAYCGAISAGCGAGAGISYLHGGRFHEIAHTLVNAVAILSGTICDGAKPSCAAKIAMAVEAGIMGFEMARTGREFFGGDGIVTKGVENTIRNVGQLARDGMSETDKEIIRIMLAKK
ncbi:MAG: serine dehydratase subunit alpha family protein [Clostridia bacterium]|nr:serine dehydratase subunit alpha family protein [Clostridia bacterium]